MCITNIGAETINSVMGAQRLVNIVGTCSCAALHV